MTQVVGVDGFARGWVGVELADGKFARVETARSLAALLASFPTASAFGIDIPIGLPHGSLRPADEAARAFVGPMRSSVFPTPPRAVLEAPDYREATGRMVELLGRGLSRQSFGLAPKILEADAIASEDPRVCEVHPEVSFCALAGGPLPHSKHSWTGFHQRLNLLRAHGIVLPDDLPGAPLVDVLDAAVAAWSAARFARGEAVPLPAGHPERIGAIWR